ncbi:hypothetical protein LFYK43_09220 [Ligilactobacillus salitolerans]|uniref:HTH cro/C1-type domain-containing protein n=1 Tax=Ligilactobacillus salitolerans TaxID=1808352 RepID=A0A401ISE7_9LACO|nr:helix-turn-helix transcriptional regulator [Ligilactobacillus salitolerans]GBG94463.1 hypothetical protein LFYK43_09220 [Ligilactobacillus salitolerans]
MINGELIRKRRKELKMSQGELARGITSQGMISQIETQTATPSAKTLEKIITRLHLDFAETVKTKEYVNCEEVLTDAGISLINRQYTQATEMLKSLGKKLTHEQTM